MIVLHQKIARECNSFQTFHQETTKKSCWVVGLLGGWVVGLLGMSQSIKGELQQILKWILERLLF